MEKYLHTFFERVAASLFTLPPTMVGMFAMYAYLVYESQALLITQLPVTLVGWQREAAAWFLSVAIHLTILTTAANSKLVHQAFPVLFAVAGYFITTLFFDAWNFSKSSQGIFVSQLFSLLIAVINYLFVGKWKEMKDGQADKEALQRAEQTVIKLSEEVSTARQSLTSLQEELTKRNEELAENKQALTKLRQNLTSQEQQHRGELQLVSENRMCITCHHKADSYQQLSRYKRDCQQCIRKRKAKQNGKATQDELFTSSPVQG